MTDRQIFKTPSPKEIVISLIAVGMLCAVILYFFFSVPEWRGICERCTGKSVKELPSELGKLNKRYSLEEFLAELPTINHSYQPDIKDPIGEEFLIYQEMALMIILEVVEGQVVRCHELGT